MVKADNCERCGKFYKTYPIILCDNPLCFASFLTFNRKEDGTMRRLCKLCREIIERKEKVQV